MSAEHTLIDLIDRSVDAATTTVLARNGSRQAYANADLVRLSKKVATGLIDAGVRAGDRVALLTYPVPDFIAGALAVWRVGAAVVPLPPPARARSASDESDVLLSRLRTSGARMLLRGGALRLPPTRLPSYDIHALASSERKELSGDEGDPDGEALILFSSGSTTEPKGVRLSHRALVANLETDRFLASLAEAPTTFVRWAELHYAAGLLWCWLRPFLLDCDSVIISKERFLAHPSVWLEEVASYPSTASGGVNLAFALAARHLESERRQKFDLSTWRVAVCSGEAANAATLRRFAAAARPHGFDPSTFQVRYASTETGTIARTETGPLNTVLLDRTALAQGRAVRSEDGTRAQEVVPVGRPLPGVSVRILDGDGNDLPDLSTGEVLVRSPSLMKGYVSDRPLENQFIDGWLKTGDVGYMDRGCLAITGRVKGSVVINGRNIWLEDLEQIVSCIDEVVGCAAVGAGEAPEAGIAILVEREPQGSKHDATLRREIMKALLARAGVTPARLVLVSRSALPRTPSGKPARGRTKELYEAGMWEAYR